MTDRYEDVRRKLLDRGYLQGRIERFLLRDLLAAGRPLRAVARTSGKAALLGAPLLGGLLAASTAAASRPLLGATDAIVLWAYFGVLAAVVLVALDLAAAGIAATWARRRGARSQDAVHAGLLVAAPLLVYLVVLQARGRPASSLLGTVLFLAAAVVATALVAWLAGIVSLAGIVGRTGEVPDRNRRGAALVLAVLLPIALAFFLVPAAAPASAGAPPSAFAASAPRERVLFVGIDGLDGALVEAGTARGATAHLLEELARGALFAKHREAGLEPAEVWTTIATGTTAAEHGVREAGATHLPGVATPLALSDPPGLLGALRLLLPVRTVPATGAGRRVRALWEIAGFAAPSAAVNFWASWPARGTAGDADDGYVVSDRVLPKLLSSGREDRDVRPESLFARLASDFPQHRAAWRAAFEKGVIGVPAETAGIAWESALIDAFSWDTVTRLAGDPKVASAFVYLPGLDILRRRLARGPSGDAAAAMIDAQILESYVRWLDTTVFADLPQRWTGWRVIVVADPGRSATAASEGFVSVAGGSAAPACVGPVVSDLDVAPLVLRVLGLPASREMTGAAPRRCFEGAPADRPEIATWGRRGLPAGTAVSDYDPEMVERLKSLGYLR